MLTDVDRNGRELPRPIGHTLARLQHSNSADTDAGFNRWRMATIGIFPKFGLRGKPTIGFDTDRDRYY